MVRALEKLKARDQEQSRRLNALEERLSALDGKRASRPASQATDASDNAPLFAGLLFGLVGLAFVPAAWRRRRRR